MSIRKQCMLTICFFCCYIFHISAQASDEKIFHFNIPAQTADTSLISFAEITKVDVLYLYDKIKTHKTRRLYGYFTAIDAIRYLIEDTPLRVEIGNKGAFNIIENSSLSPPKSKSKFHQLLLSLLGSNKKNKLILPESGIEKITVTSQKRQEYLRQVPLSISVINGKQIDNLYINNIENIQLTTPSLTLRKGNTSRNSSVFIRGLGTHSFSIAAEPSVSTVIDGVVLARSGQFFSDTYDIQRIEVLRGPQGMLFGKNSSSGVVNVITKKPSSEFEGSLDYSIFQGNESILKGRFSGHISTNINASLSTYIGSYDGNYKNTFTNSKINGYQRKGARIFFDIFPRDFLNMRFSIDYFKADDNCCIEITSPPTVDLSTVKSVSHDKETRSQDKEFGSSFTANLDLNGVTFTSITAYRIWDNTEDSDRDFMSNVGKVFRANQPNEFQLHEFGQQTFKQFSEEIRLVSPSDQTLEYSLGLFYFNVESKRFFSRNDRLCLNTTLLNDVCEEGKSTFISPSASANMTSNFENYAAYGHGKYNFMEDWDVIFGLRWTHDEVAYTHSRTSNRDHKDLINMKEDTNNPIDFGAPGIRDKSYSNEDHQFENNLSYKLGLQYDLSPEVMAYTMYSTGFKGPAYDVSFSMNEERSRPINSEKSKSIEFGLKGESKDGKLYLGLAMYYSEIDGFQMNSSQNLNGNISSSLNNIGIVNNSGFEIDFTSSFIDRMKLIGSISFLKDAKIKKVFCHEKSSQNIECELRKNERLMLSPKIKASLGVDYFVPLSNDIFNLSVSAQYSFQGKMFSDDMENPYELIKSHNLLNASINMYSINERHKLSFIIKNITNQHSPSQIICCAVGAQENLLRYQIPRDYDRYIGLNYRLSFN
jgi:iron complex outermembrane receptor protein